MAGRIACCWNGFGAEARKSTLARSAVPKADFKPTAEVPQAVEGAIESIVVEGAFMPTSISLDSSSLCREPPL